jgi:predicted peptidase
MKTKRVRMHIQQGLFLFILFFLPFSLMAQDTSLYKHQYYIEKKDSLPYRVLLPVDYDPSIKYPLILFLHGSGERGKDNESQLIHGGEFFLRDSIRKRFKAIVVFPQCSNNSYWSNVNIISDTIQKTQFFNFQEDGDPTSAMSLLLGLTKQLSKKYRLDENRLYVGGLSMGGMGTFELVRRKPKLFAAAFAICGGANASTADEMKNTAWWIFHGLKDNVVDPIHSKIITAALKAAGADVRLTLYPDANHNSWDAAFAEKELLPWLFSHHK